MNTIQYVTGSLFEHVPIRSDHVVVCHVCNNIGAWGAGFTQALSAHWAEPERSFRELRKPVLGSVQFVPVTENTTVANMVAQAGVRYPGRRDTPLKLDALRLALQTVADTHHPAFTTIHMPRIGCGLGGGKWEDVSKVIKEELIDSGYSVTVYDLPPRS